MRSYDVFLSYSTADEQVVEELAARLRNEGLEPFFGKWNVEPGEFWQDELQEALTQCATCVVFVGSEGVGGWQLTEIRTALDKRVQDPGFRLIPVLLPGPSSPRSSDLPLFLRQLQWVEFSERMDDIDLRRLVRAINEVSSGSRDGSELTDQAPGSAERVGKKIDPAERARTSYENWSALQAAIDGLHRSAPEALARHLTETMLEKIAEEMREVQFQAEQFTRATGYRDYRERIHSILDRSKNDDTTILAVCGEKGLRDDEETLRYFQPFLTFPESEKHQVYRVFVERAERQPHLKPTLLIIREHEKCAGVCPLNVSRQARELVDKKHPGICAALDSGFGLVIFVTPQKVFAVVHRGVKELLSYAEFERPAVVRELVRLTGALYKASAEYRKNPDLKREIDQMLQGILARTDRLQ